MQRQVTDISRWLVAFAVLLSGVLALPAGATAQGTAQRVSLAQFKQLQWLSGTWRGSGGAYAAFFEEYRVVNDSTMVMRAFSDSTLSVTTDSSTIQWRNGIVLKRSSRSTYIAAKLTESSVHFMREGATSGGHTFTRTSADQWTASLHPATPNGSETVYIMRRIRRDRTE